MDKERLQEIKERRHRYINFLAKDHHLIEFIDTDAGVLIAEVERLSAIVESGESEGDRYAADTNNTKKTRNRHHLAV